MTKTLVKNYDAFIFLVTFGYYSKSKEDPTRLVYIQPRRIRSFQELRQYHSLGAALYNSRGAFYVNEILDTSQSDLSDESLDEMPNGQDDEESGNLHSTKVACTTAAYATATPMASATATATSTVTSSPTAEPTLTQIATDINDANDNANYDAGQIELVSDNSDNVVVVSDENIQSDSSDDVAPYVNKERVPVATSPTTNTDESDASTSSGASTTATSQYRVLFKMYKELM